MVNIEVEAHVAPLVKKLLEKMQSLQNGEIKIIFRDGQPARLDRDEWELLGSRARAVGNPT